MLLKADSSGPTSGDVREKKSWSCRSFFEAENRCVLFLAFAPTGQDSKAQGAALGCGTTNIGEPQRGVTRLKCRESFAPLGQTWRAGS